MRVSDLARPAVYAKWACRSIPLHVLQDILGHASVETTRGYLHPDNRHLAPAAAAEQGNVFLARSAAGSAKPARTSPPRSL